MRVMSFFLVVFKGGRRVSSEKWAPRVKNIGNRLCSKSIFYLIKKIKCNLPAIENRRQNDEALSGGECVGSVLIDYRTTRSSGQSGLNGYVRAMFKR